MSDRPNPTWSKVTTRWSTSKSGATKRHMFWSQPYPWAKTIGRPSGTPLTRTSFRVLTITRPRYPPGSGQHRPVRERGGSAGPDTGEHHAARRAGGDPPQRDAQVLCGQRVLQPGQPDGERREQRDGDVLPRAAVPGARVAGALRHQLPRPDRLDVVAVLGEEPLGTEGVRLGEQVRVVVLPEQVQQHHRPGRHPL